MLGQDQVAIETPEQIELQLEPAGLGSRFTAWVVDSLVKALVVVVVLIVLGVLGILARLDAQGLAILSAILLFFYGFVYDTWNEVRRNGQTPGKRFQRLRVIRDGGGSVDFQTAALRYLLVIVDFLPVLYLLGAVLILLSKKRQRLGDLAAGTIVIRERAAAPPDLDALVEQQASPRIAFRPEQLASCTASDRQLLLSFFHRYREMTPAGRDELGMRLADLFQKKLDWQMESATSYLEFLASLFRDLQQWARH